MVARAAGGAAVTIFPENEPQANLRKRPQGIPMAMPVLTNWWSNAAAAADAPAGNHQVLAIKSTC